MPAAAATSPIDTAASRSAISRRVTSRMRSRELDMCQAYELRSALHMSSTHPAEQAARAAMGAVTAGDRAAWLHAYAEAAVLHDPVGGSPLDPDGAGLKGRAALEQFWDLTVEPNDVSFTIAAVHPSGDEAAVVASVDIAFAN